MKTLFECKKKTNIQTEPIDKKIKGIAYFTNNCSFIKIYFTFFPSLILLKHPGFFLFISVMKQTTLFIPSRRPPPLTTKKLT